MSVTNLNAALSVDTHDFRESNISHRITYVQIQMNFCYVQIQNETIKIVIEIARYKIMHNSVFLT